MTSIENMIRAELERMGVRADDEQQETRQQKAPQYVSVEAVLSAAIGDRPVVGVNGIRGLNDDHGIARAIGANSLNGERL